ncbi:MAG: D-tyrosyl-tRNA(Tyr) deacylase [Clostridia bacterium]|nr:D-tyrosyl-tRNA(Tyr) deacylase [Clostridia bacterium]
MKAVIQRVQYASVEVDGKVVGSCKEGYLLLLGVAEGDTTVEADLLARKILDLRIFQDEAGKMNRSIKDIAGEVLLISQFTLLADYRRGNRPDFLASAKPDVAKPLYEYFGKKLEEGVGHVGYGIFGADMKVSLLNDGPVTIVMDSDVLKQKRRS